MRKIGPALLIVVTAATLTACTAPNDAPAPTPSASSSGPIYPDLDHATVDFIIGLIAGAAA